MFTNQVKWITFFIDYMSPRLCFYFSFLICWFVFWILPSILSTLFSRESRESSWLSISDWRPRPRLFSLLKPSHMSSKWYKNIVILKKKKTKNTQHLLKAVFFCLPKFLSRTWWASLRCLFCEYPFCLDELSSFDAVPNPRTQKMRKWNHLCLLVGVTAVHLSALASCIQFSQVGVTSLIFIFMLSAVGDGTL